ncbi:hypothetical protein HID58_059902 [Brassica napus]|uniref:Uncharacterized protein n=1 Tax=Brassica napus TaxID=3708 RepID=A0ABQ7ZV17_BRANA|nr:hypothetical protein HID58_059902 [Brassica napus]
MVRQIHIWNQSMIVLSTFDVYVFGAPHQKFFSINISTSSYGCINVELPHDFFHTVEHDFFLFSIFCNASVLLSSMSPGSFVSVVNIVAH